MQPLTLQEFAQLQYPVSPIKIEERWYNSQLYKHNSAHYLLHMYNVLCTLLHHITAMAKGKQERKKERERTERERERLNHWIKSHTSSWGTLHPHPFSWKQKSKDIVTSTTVRLSEFSLHNIIEMVERQGIASVYKEYLVPVMIMGRVGSDGSRGSNMIHVIGSQFLSKLGKQTQQQKEQKGFSH